MIDRSSYETARILALEMRVSDTRIRNERMKLHRPPDAQAVGSHLLSNRTGIV